MKASAAVSLAILGFLGLSSTGAKALSFDLTTDACTGGCLTGGNSLFGTVTVTQTGSGSSFIDTFTVQMNNPTYVFNGNGNGFDAFTFNLAAAGQTVSLSQAMTTAGFGIDTTLPQHTAAFGNFSYGITLTNAGTGATQLVFNVTDINALSAASFLLSTGNTPSFFAADILSANGNTGTVGVAATPLPAALPLYASGLGALALLRWRRKRKAAAGSKQALMAA
jgi:hypothetical protein